MESFRQNIKNNLGALYGEALITYEDSNAAKSEEIIVGLGLALASYTFIRTARVSLESSKEESQIILFELSKVAYGLLILYEGSSNPEIKSQIAQTIFQLCEEAEIFEKHGNQKLHQAFSEFCTYFHVYIDQVN